MAAWSLGFWGGGRCGLDFGLNIFAQLWAICAIKDVDNRPKRQFHTLHNDGPEQCVCHGRQATLFTVANGQVKMNLDKKIEQWYASLA